MNRADRFFTLALPFFLVLDPFFPFLLVMLMVLLVMVHVLLRVVESTDKKRTPGNRRDTQGWFPKLPHRDERPLRCSFKAPVGQASCLPLVGRQDACPTPL